jgi:NADH-quinone oxidoreductase subunit N
MIPTPEVQWLAILPELILALGAAAVLLVEVQWKPRTWVLGVLSAWVLFLALGVTVLQWDNAMTVGQARGGSLIAFSGMVFLDGLAVFGRLALMVVTATGLIAGWRFVESLGRRSAEAIALIFLATAGFSLMIASNNLILMFLGLEVGSIAFYVLTGLTTERRGSDEAAMKYFLLGSFASAILVYGVALLYAGTGQFEILAMRQFFSSFVIPGSTVILAGMALVIVGLAFKVSAAPFHSWAPDVYAGAPAGVVGYMAAMAKVAGFITLARVLETGLGGYYESWAPILAVIAAISMVVGSLFALVQSDVRRMLAYSGVAHAGFIMTGIVGDSTIGVLFYVVIYGVQLVGGFAVVSAVSGAGSSGSPLSAYRGLASSHPWLAHGFTVLLLGMAGLPLTAGFIAKFTVLSEAWAEGWAWLVFVGVLASVLALAVYLRLIVAMYMDKAEDAPEKTPVTVAWVVVLAVVVTILLGLWPGPLLDLASNAFAL